MEPRPVWRKARVPAGERRGMGLFRRKPKVEDQPARCPLCTERLPDGASECAMCGADLRALGVAHAAKQARWGPAVR